MSAARPTWWCPNIPGLKKIVTGRRSLAPDSTAKRSSTRCSSSASSGVTSACSGGETTRLAAPDRTGTRTSPEPAAARRDMAIRGVVPEPARDAPADRQDRAGLRLVVADVAHDELDGCAFIQPDGHRAATEPPRVDDVFEIEIRVERPAVDQQPPLHARRGDTRKRLGIPVADELGKIFEHAAVVHRQVESGENHLAPGIRRVRDSRIVEIVAVHGNAAEGIGPAVFGRFEIRRAMEGAAVHRRILLMRARRWYEPVGVPGAPSVL